MKAAIMREYHRPLELVDLPRPEPSAPNDVLVRIGGAGVCATDLHAIEGLMEPAGVTLPRVLGHENAGWVEEVGAGVSTVAAGDAVLVYPPYSCGLCLACRRGNDMHCARHQFTGLSVDGGFADYVRRVGALAPAAAGRRGAGRGRAPRRRGADRLPRGAAARSPRRARHDGGRRRCGRRRPHRGAAAARAGLEHRRSPSTRTSGAGGSRQSSARTRSSRETGRSTRSGS